MTAQTPSSSWITVPGAAELAGVSNETIYNWIEDFGIGKKIAGRWRVEKEKLDKILAGEVTYENQGRPKKSKKEDSVSGQ